MSCQCNCGNQQAANMPKHDVELRRLKRELNRLTKSVRAALDQATEESGMLNEAATDDERVLILSDAIEALRNKLGFLSED